MSEIKNLIRYSENPIPQDADFLQNRQVFPGKDLTAIIYDVHCELFCKEIEFSKQMFPQSDTEKTNFLFCQNIFVFPEKTWLKLL